MSVFIIDIILFLIIIVNPCLLLPLPKNDMSEGSGPKQLVAIRNDIYTSTTNPVTEVTRNRDWFKGMFLDENKKSDDDTSLSLSRRPRGRQMMEQFSQKNLSNNQHDASNLDRILWQYFYRQNYHPQLLSSTAASKSSSLNPLNPLDVHHVNTLLTQETAQLDPIYVVNKPAAETTGAPSIDNFFIDLLHNQPSITGPNTNGFGSLSKISRPHFNSYVAGLASSVKGIMSDNYCSLIVKMLPVFLMDNFIRAIITISNLKLPTSLMIPFVVLSVINFITSFLFLDEYCPGSR